MSSRVAKEPIVIPKGVEVTLAGQDIKVKGSKGEMAWNIHRLVEVIKEEESLQVKHRKDSIESNALAGTTRALVNNMVKGVSEGFSKKLLLVGVGYRAQLQGTNINLSLGFSHPVIFELPEGVKAECPSQTELVLSGCDKQKVCQVAANIRSLRPPEPYKGKGVRYDGERVVLKETKKK